MSTEKNRLIEIQEKIINKQKELIEVLKKETEDKDVVIQNLTKLCADTIKLQSNMMNNSKEELSELVSRIKSKIEFLKG